MGNQNTENNRLDACQCTDAKSYEKFRSKQVFLEQIAMSGDIETMIKFIGKDEPLKHETSKALMNFVWNYLWEKDIEILLGTIGMKRNLRRIFLLGWATIRKVDDLLDSLSSPELQMHETQKVIQYINDIERDKTFIVEDIFDKILNVYVLLEKNNTLNTLDCFKKLAHSADLDIARRGKILTWNEYEELVYYKAECTTEYWVRFLLNRNDKITEEFAHHFGRLSQYWDDVVDLNKDLKVGMINITKDELERFKIYHIINMTSEQIKKLCDYRESLICNHCVELLKVIDTVGSYYQRRLLKSYLAYQMQNIQNNTFYPDAPYSFPFLSLYRWLLNSKDPSAHESLYQMLGQLSVLFPIGKIPTEPSYVRNNGTKKR
ncbi:hypothetical protein ig2599ANME_1580 [groundwater metagenome]